MTKARSQFLTSQCGPTRECLRLVGAMLALALLLPMSTLRAADEDGDGMDDAWEVANGLDPAMDDAQLDPDGDGLTPNP